MVLADEISRIGIPLSVGFRMADGASEKDLFWDTYALNGADRGADRNAELMTEFCATDMCSVIADAQLGASTPLEGSLEKRSQLCEIYS